MITRRDFLKTSISFIITTFVSTLFPKKVFSVLPPSQKRKSILAVASGENKKELLKSALQSLGGIEKWVKSGNTVVIKPNAAWSRTPEEAANVHPELAKALIEICYEAGARQVKVIEHPCDNPKSAFKINGIQDAVAGTKAELQALGDDNDFVTVQVPQGKKLKKVDIAKEIQTADVFINMPIAKTHGTATLTLGMKNHMGAVKNRWYFHINNLHQCIADVSTVLRPDLIIVDATRLMLTNGPKGPGEVRIEDKVIVGTDQVAVDSYAATLFGYKGTDIGHIAKAYEHGVGEIDLDKVEIRTSTV